MNFLVQKMLLERGAYLRRGLKREFTILKIYVSKPSRAAAQG